MSFLKPGTSAARCMYLPPAYQFRWVPFEPVLKCPTCLGLRRSLMSQMRTPSSFGLVGSPPHSFATFSKAVIIVFPERSVWMVHVLGGPGMNLTTFGFEGSVTSTIDQPKCHKWP